MKARQDAAKRIVIIVGIVQFIALAYFFEQYYRTPVAERSEIFLILFALSLVLLVRLYLLFSPKRPKNRPFQTSRGKTVHKSVHGLALGDVVYVRHLDTNAKIVRINEDETFVVKTLLNLTFTVDIGMIEIPKKTLEQ